MDQHIARTAARLRIGLFAAVAVMVVLYLAARFQLQVGQAHVEYRSHGVTPAAARIAGDGTMVMLLVALWRLTQMLGLIRDGDMFSVDVVRRFRGFAFWLLLMALYGFAAPILLTFARGLPDGQHRIAFALDLRELLTVGITLLLFLLARLLERARAIEAEMREIV
jgi:hypothetical protein